MKGCSVPLVRVATYHRTIRAQQHRVTTEVAGDGRREGEQTRNRQMFRILFAGRPQGRPGNLVVVAVDGVPEIPRAPQQSAKHKRN